MISGYVACRSRRLPACLDRPLVGAAPQGPLGDGQTGTMPAQFIFTMRDLRRFYPPDREVLRGINLSFYPGAKIGVIGANGSGKSSLLRIMAGADDGLHRRGPAHRRLHCRVPCPGAGARSDQGRRRQRGRRGSRDQTLARPLRRGVRRHGRSRRRLRQAARRAGPAAGPHRRRRSLGTRPQARDSHGCAAAATCRRRRLDAVRRRATPGGPVPVAPFQPRPALARRADEPPRRRIGGVARADPAGLSRERSWRSPTTGTSSTTSPGGSWSSTGASASPGRATTPRGWSRNSSAWRAKRRPTRPGRRRRRQW